MPAATGDQQLPRPQEVFISYSRKDKEFVHRLDEALKRRGREAWVDWEDIRPTEEFMQAIYGAIESADTFVFVLTPDSVASEVCGREIANIPANDSMFWGHRTVMGSLDKSTSRPKSRSY